MTMDNLIHLGAGVCSELNAYLERQPKRLVLVEADPKLADALQMRINGKPHVQVHCMAVSGRPGPATFHRYNLPDAGSLHIATGLFDLFPGLKAVEQIPVEAVSPTVLLKGLELRPAQSNKLVIDLPGEEMSVLRALQDDRLLSLFGHLLLHCGRAPLYEGSESAAVILEWLREQGFDLISEDSSRDPERPCWELRRNAAHLRIMDLEQQAIKLQEQLTRAKEEASVLASERQTLLDQANKSKAEQVKLAEERRVQIEQLTRAKDEAARHAEELQKNLLRISRTRDEQAQLAGERQAQINKLEAILRDMEARQGVMVEEMVKAEGQIDLIKDVLLREQGR